MEGCYIRPEKYAERQGSHVQYHEVKINLEFESKANCVTTGSGPTDDLASVSLWVDYIFLDTDERRRFAQLSHEYLIEQLQFTGDETLVAGPNRIKLNYNHPVKELIWVGIRSNVASNAWTNYVNNDTVASGVNMVETAKLQLNGHDRFAERDGAYFNLVQPFQHHENVPSNRGINVYSFAILPEQHQPSGTLNMSRIDTAVLSVTAKAAAGKIKIFATNYNVILFPHCAGRGTRSALKSYTPKHCGLKFWENRLDFHRQSVASVGCVSTPRKTSCCSGNPLEPNLPNCERKNTMAENNELGYGKNDWDWATRMLITYVRYRKDMVRRQRLNGCRSSFTSVTNSRWLKIQSRPLGKLIGEPVFVK